MATDLDKLVVQLSADIKGYEREMRKAVGVTNKQARVVEKRFRTMSRNLDGIGRRAARSLIAPLSGIAAALGTREIIRYADAWTIAGNKIASSSKISGMQARSLSALNEIADDTRSGLSETVDLYSKLLRASAGVAKSELEVARATETVNKAFKAAGAEASEQAAGILQLSQGLGSGILQGDELRSVRENAPLLAQAIAEYFGVTIAGLKSLGEEGKLTSEGVFRAILSGQSKIEAAFSTTNATMHDGFTRLNNAVLEYIGLGDESVNVSSRITAALIIIADNFDTVADAGLKMAAILAAGLLGRSISKMIVGLTGATSVLVRFGAALRVATSLTGVATAMSGLSAAAGPLGVVIGSLLAGGVLLYSDRAREATARSDALREELRDMGLYAPEAAESIEGLAESIDGIGSQEQLERIEKLRKGLQALRGAGGLSSLIFGDSSEISSFISEIDGELKRVFGDKLSLDDKGVALSLRNLAKHLKDNKISVTELRAEMGKLPLAEAGSEVRSWAVQLLDTGRVIEATEKALLSLEASADFNAANAEIERFAIHLDHVANIGQLDRDVVDSVDQMIESFHKGEISAADAATAITALGDVHPKFEGLFSQLATAISWLGSLRDAAKEAKAALPGVEGGGGSVDTPDAAQGAANQAFIDEQKRQNALSRERQDIEKRTEVIMRDAAKAGAVLTQQEAERLAIAQAAADARRAEEGKSARGGGRRGEKRTEYDDQIIKVRESIQALKDEADALNGLESSYDGYADVLTYVQKRMELLIAAKRQGIEVTPQLAAEIDALAQEYVKAGNAADDARERHEEFENALEEFRATQESAFTGLITGAHGFKDALSQVISKLAEMAASRAFESLWDGGLGSLSGGILKGLGFSGGGYTGSGGKHDPAGVVHKGEYVMDAETVRKAGGPAAFDAMRRGLRGYADGGYVGPSIPRGIAVGGRASDGPAITFAPVIDARGTDVAGIQRLEAAMGRMSAEFEGRAINAYNMGKKRRLIT